MTRIARSYVVNGSLAVGLALSAAQWAVADDAPRRQSDDGPIVFRLLIEQVPAGGVQVTNGVPAPLENWNALIIAGVVVETDPTTHLQKLGSCTATLIGPQTVLLAAHCVDKGLFGGVRDAQIKRDGYPAIAMRCEIAADYASEPYQFGSPRSSADYALCELDRAIPRLPSNFYYESIAIDRALAPHEPIVISGYGCTKLTFERGVLAGGGASNVLNIGDQVVEASPPHAGRDANYALLRSKAGQKPALCPGDSGGPVLTGISTLRQTSYSRRVRAVNSSVDAVIPGTLQRAGALDRNFDLISRVSDLSQPSFRAFLNSWVSRHPRSGVVCGYANSAGHGSCR